MTGKKRRKGQGGGGGGAELGARAQKLLKEAAELYERRAKGNTKSTLKAAWRAAEDFVDTAGQLQGVSTQDVKLLRQRLADVHAERVQGAPDDDKDDGAKLRTGDWVKAHSLAENHLNGERGHLASFDQEKGRWEVHFPFATGGAVTCRIRERNLSKDTERSSKDHVDQAWRLFRRGQYEVAEGCCHQALQLAWTFEEQTNAAHCLCAVTHAEAQRHAISDWGHDRELELVAMRALQLLRTSASFRSALPDVANPSTIVPFLRKMRAAASAFGLEAAAPHLGYRWVALEAPSPLQAPGSRLATLRAEQTASPNGFANCRPMRQAEILVLCLQVLTRPFLDDAQSALLCRGVDEKLAELVAAAKPNTDVSDLRAADFAACGASVEDTVEALRRIAQTPPPTVPGYDCRMTTADNPTMTVGEEWVLPLFLVGKTEAPFVELQAQNFAGYLMESALHRPQHHPLRRPLKIALGGEQKRAAARLAAARSARPEDAAALVNSAFANIDDGTPVRQLQEVMQGAGVPDDSLQDAVVRLRRISAVEPGSMKGRSQRRSLDWVALPDHRLVLSARKAETLHFEGICEKALRCEKPQRTIRATATASAARRAEGQPAVRVAGGGSGGAQPRAAGSGLRHVRSPAGGGSDGIGACAATPAGDGGGAERCVRLPRLRRLQRGSHRRPCRGGGRRAQGDGEATQARAGARVLRPSQQLLRGRRQRAHNGLGQRAAGPSRAAGGPQATRRVAGLAVLARHDSGRLLHR
eukprot:TRINITY_DN7639_c0_g1_i2.p1 TRINITY_DN7639_c0_g1~~TRINITY_DN7639_c0_g1_i2.p1  ORF type:complete len:768 (+),score=142.34 TRINITY_DN7639_c0_g1_i2:41-2305(+)